MDYVRCYTTFVNYFTFFCIFICMVLHYFVDLLMFNLKPNKMKNHKLTPSQYNKAIELGYYEPVKCISVFKKIVKHYKVCGRTEILLIDLK